MAHRIPSTVVEPPGYDEIASRSREASTYGLELLHILDSDYSLKLDDAVLLTLISFAYPSEPWSTEETTCALATALLDRQLARNNNDNDNDISLEDLLVEVVLKSYLRPLFSKSRPATVTPSGRKAAFQDEHDPHRGLSDETPAIKPWKYLDHRAIPVFHFAVRKAEASYNPSATSSHTMCSPSRPLFLVSLSLPSPLNALFLSPVQECFNLSG